MKTVAIYKTFRGDEFACASLASIYHLIDRVIFIHCDTSWGGREGNTVRERVLDWCSENDTDDKVIHTTSDNPDQTAAYELAWKLAGNIEHDWKMLIDTDEVWDKKSLGELLEFARTCTADSITCAMHEYVKSPLFRICPTPPLRPTVLVKAGVKYSAVRCSDIVNSSEAPVFFHHFTLVRKTLYEIIAKQSECCCIENEKYIEWVDWVLKKWNRLPDAKDLKPLQSYYQAWPGVTVIKRDELPEPVREMELVKAFEAYDFRARFPNVEYKEVNELELRAKYGIDPDFGPGHPRWGVPSTMTKYRRMMEELTSV